MGYHIQKNRVEKFLNVDQHIHLKPIVDRFNVSKTRKLLTSNNSKINTLPPDYPATAEKKEQIRTIPYCEGVGAILRERNMTRLGIVDAVTRYCENSGQVHWGAVAKV